jgi:hypothetical protein
VISASPPAAASSPAAHAFRLVIGDPRDRPETAAARLVQTWQAGGTGTTVAKAFFQDDIFVLAWLGIGVLAFRPGHANVTVWPETGVSPATLDDIFYRQIQPILLQATGWQALHSSAVCLDEGLLVLCGRAHSGKSTFAYALGQRGYPQFTDDQLVWRPTAQGFETHRLPFKPRLRPPARAFFGDEDLNTFEMPPVPAGIGIARVVVLTQTDEVREVALKQYAAPEGFSQLLGFAHFFNPTERTETMRLVRDYSEFVNRVPILALTFPAGFSHFERVLELLLTSTGVPPTSFGA